MSSLFSQLIGYFNLKKLVNIHKVNKIIFVNFQDSKAKKVEVFGIACDRITQSRLLKIAKDEQLSQIF
ncbi:hypothetical protein [Nostoc sp. FACHB-190]|uniref:hypothetical protein n=1 Tax=Nostoc sp. FACHB-190 TaxID=2692838 RepID=UPI0016863A2B|nr:hypothetical protein [Nostoc sp. FACHB-190]